MAETPYNKKKIKWLQNVLKDGSIEWRPEYEISPFKPPPSEIIVANISSSGNSATATSSSYSSFATSASYAFNATSASYAISASYEIIKEVSSSHADFADTASLAYTASYALNATSASYALNATSASYALTASYVDMVIESASYALTASYVENAQTASYVLNAISASYASTASYVLNAISASYASTASYVNPLVQNVIITGSVDVLNGNINLEANAFFLQGTSVGGGTVSLIGVNSSNQTYIGNQGLTNILADSTIISGSLVVSGSNTNLISSITTKTTRVTGSSYTVLDTDYRIGVRYTLTGSCTLQLPDVSTYGERELRFKDEEGNADTNNITLVASGSNLIDGDTTAILDRNYIAISLYNDGINNWYIE